MPRIAVIGAGAFGTALAISMARHGDDVVLWARDAEQVAQMRASRENARRLPGCPLLDSIAVTNDLADLEASAMVLLALPAQKTSDFLSVHHESLPKVPLVMCAKGISAQTLELQTEIAAPYAPALALSGPGFAVDIAAGKPTAMVLAGKDELTEAAQALIGSRTLRLYRNHDAIGAQLGGALKNVVALAAGIALGAGLGESGRAAIMTRGFAEMRRLARAVGAEDETLMGLSGFGDLALTASSTRSRNYAHGLAVGAGETPGSATVEGIATAQATCALAAREGIEMPIAEAVEAILSGRATVTEAVSQLLTRPAGRE